MPTKAPAKTKYPFYKVSTVENGFVVYTGEIYNDCNKTFVFATPEDLAKWVKANTGRN